MTLPIVPKNEIVRHLVSTRNLAVPVEAIYIVPESIPLSMVCTDMLLPWSGKGLPNKEFESLTAQVTSLVNAINSKNFPKIWEKVHGKQFRVGEKIRVMITEQGISLEPVYSTAKKRAELVALQSTPDKDSINEARTIIAKSKVGKKILGQLDASVRLTQDILKNMIKIAEQELCESQRHILRIQLGE